MSTRLAFPSDGVYRARQNILLAGVSLAAGDLVPSDSPLRQDVRKIEQLCQQNLIMPGALDKAAAKPKVAEAATPSATKAPDKVPVAAAKPTAPVKVSKPVTQKKVAKPAIDIDSLSKAELIDKLEDLGLKTTGGKEQLQERLRIALA